MPLPVVKGWIINYRTAKNILASKSNVRTAHCVKCCQDGIWVICHQEEHYFKDDDVTSGTFVNGNSCVFDPTEAAYEICPVVASYANGKLLLGKSNTTLLIVAIAAIGNFGIISDFKSPKFATVHDLAPPFGIPELTADDYFASLKYIFSIYTDHLPCDSEPVNQPSEKR